MIRIHNVFLALLIPFALLALSPTADAAIRCKGIFQVNKLGLFASPYCAEGEIARVAQSYGEKVTADQVRNNPLTKVRLCQIYGGDVRLKGACAGYAPDAYGIP